MHSSTKIDLCKYPHFQDIFTILTKEILRFYRTESDPKIPVNELFAVARLAHKYEMDELLRQAMACFKAYYTSRFDVWDKQGQLGDVPFDLCERDTPFYAIGVINLARLTDNISMLPLAFYDCCSLGGRVMQGWTHPDGTVEHLSPEDLERFIDGSTALTSRAVRAALQLVDQTYCMKSKYSSPCKSACEFMKQKLANRLATMRGENALHSYKQLACLAQHLPSVCTACSGALSQEDLKTRKTIWAELPALFGLQLTDWEKAD